MRFIFPISITVSLIFLTATLAACGSYPLVYDDIFERVEESPA